MEKVCTTADLLSLGHAADEFIQKRVEVNAILHEVMITRSRTLKVNRLLEAHAILAELLSKYPMYSESIAETSLMLINYVIDLKEKMENEGDEETEEEGEPVDGIFRTTLLLSKAMVALAGDKQWEKLVKVNTQLYKAVKAAGPQDRLKILLEVNSELSQMLGEDSSPMLFKMVVGIHQSLVGNIMEAVVDVNAMKEAGSLAAKEEDTATRPVIQEEVQGQESSGDVVKEADFPQETQKSAVVVDPPKIQDEAPIHQDSPEVDLQVSPADPAPLTVQEKAPVDQDSQDIELQVSQEVEVQVTQEVELQVSQEIEVQVSPKVEVQVSPKVEVQVSPKVEVQVSPKVEVQGSPEVDVQVTPKVEIQISTTDPEPLTVQEEVPVAADPVEVTANAPNVVAVPEVGVQTKIPDILVPLQKTQVAADAWEDNTEHPKCAEATDRFQHTVPKKVAIAPDPPNSVQLNLCPSMEKSLKVKVEQEKKPLSLRQQMGNGKKSNVIIPPKHSNVVPRSAALVMQVLAEQKSAQKTPKLLAQAPTQPGSSKGAEKPGCSRGTAKSAGQPSAKRGKRPPPDTSRMPRRPLVKNQDSINLEEARKEELEKWQARGGSIY